MSGNTKPHIKADTLRGFKYLNDLLPMLQRYHSVGQHHNRKLHFDQYLALIILYFFNPVLTSLRAIQQATTIKAVQKKLGVEATSLGSLSEASYVFDAELLQPLLKELVAQALPLEKDPRLKELQQALIAVDGTLLPALPKMCWALWLDEQNRAAKLHLALDVEHHMPVGARITHGNANEKNVVRESFLKSDALYVLDAGYAEYKFFQDILTASSSFIGRIKDNAVWEEISSNQLSCADKAAGVTRDIIVKLGSKTKQKDLHEPVRIIEIFHEGDESVQRKSRVSSKKTFRTTEPNYTLLLATDRMDLAAEVIALCYQNRWQVELFFRWFKCTLGCQHLLALSKNGVAIQVYCALIASMLITIWSGRKPTKRTFEMFQLYFLGWVTDQELEQHLNSIQEKKKNNS
jgi:Transposase DDE domain